jgi:hypothetical protein
MKVTQKNINTNGKMQVVFANRSDKTKGIRITGTACIEGNKILLKALKAESLL